MYELMKAVKGQDDEEAEIEIHDKKQ